MSPASPTARILAAIGFLLAAPAAHADNAVKKLLVGDTKVDIVAKYQGDPLPKPDKIVVEDFNVPAGTITVDESPAARLHRPGKDDEGTGSPEAVARRVQSSFSKALLHELQEASLPVEAAAAPDDSALPPHTLLIQGDFTNIKEGNKTKRILIGFGKGASDVQAHVMVSLATEQEPVTVLEFNVISRSGKKPGAAATVGAGAATMGTATAGSAAAGVASGGILDRAATVEADASRMAKGVAKQIVELMKSQPWAAPETPAATPP